MTRACFAAALGLLLAAVPLYAGSAWQPAPAEGSASGRQTADQQGGGESAGAPAASPQSCATALPGNPRASVYEPPPPQAARHRPAGHAKRDEEPKGHRALSGDPTPTLQTDTAFCTEQAAARYRQIAAQGGWPTLPRPFGPGAAKDPQKIHLLRQRLAAEGDLDEAAPEDIWDDALTAALMRFQERAGIAPSGQADKETLDAMNVPADVRARQLEQSAKRIRELLGRASILADRPYLAVNIPSASVEAVENFRAVQRHAAVAGRPDDPSPQISTLIRGITINPSWTIPRAIIEREVIPRLRRDPGYLRRAHLVVLDGRGHRVSLRRALRAHGESFIIRQEPGAKNALGRLRIDMPNTKQVYMHDTPDRRLFADNYRFLSHGCVRVDGIYDLATWLLNDGHSSGRWNRQAIEDAVARRAQKKIKLPHPLPVAWVYLDAWENADGVIHFAPDVYDLDGAAQKQEATSPPQDRAPASKAAAGP